MRLTVPALLVAALMTAAAPALAQETMDKPAPKAAAKTTLAVGDAAPALSVGKWLKGAPVTSFEKGKVYVVEFWATWCGPCIASMPHLSALQKEYDGKVTIIGMTSMDPRNTAEKAEKMVAAKGDTMGYTVAWDNDRATNTAYMTAADQHYIPCAFVVDKAGKVAYVGNNPAYLDIVLEQVVAGKWDIKAGNAEIDATNEALKGLSPTDPKAAVKTLDGIVAKTPKMAPVLAETYNAIAWSIVDPDADNKSPDLDTAMKAADQAVKATKAKDGAILDTLARVYWLKGDKAMAIETETKAIENSPAEMKDDLKKTLDEYKKQDVKK